MTLALSKCHIPSFLSFPFLYHLFSSPLPLSLLRLFAVDRALRGRLAVINGTVDRVDGGGLMVLGGGVNIIRGESNGIHRRGLGRERKDR